MGRAQIINFLVFQIGWFAAVWGAGNGRYYDGPLLIFSYTLWHLWQTRRQHREWQLLVSATILGLVVDCLQVKAGLLSYQGPLLSPLPLPLWVISLWVVLAASFNLSMRWIMQHPWAALGFGFVGGPLSYLAGQRLGGVTLHHANPMGLAILGAIWATLMILFQRLTRRLIPSLNS